MIFLIILLCSSLISGVGHRARSNSKTLAPTTNESVVYNFKTKQLTSEETGLLPYFFSKSFCRCRMILSMISKGASSSFPFSFGCFPSSPDLRGTFPIRISRFLPENKENEFQLKSWRLAGVCREFLFRFRARLKLDSNFEQPRVLIYH